jgi:hypothetical protein
MREYEFHRSVRDSHPVSMASFTITGLRPKRDPWFERDGDGEHDHGSEWCFATAIVATGSCVRGSWRRERMTAPRWRRRGQRRGRGRSVEHLEDADNGGASERRAHQIDGIDQPYGNGLRVNARLTVIPAKA